MRSQESAVPFRYLLLIFPLLIIAVSVSFLATPNYLYATIPGAAILFLLLLGKFPQVGYYAIVFMIPFGAFRGDIPWVIAFSLILLTLFQFLFHKRITERLKSKLWIWFFVLYIISIFSTYFSKYPETSYHNLYLLAVGYMFFALNLIFLSKNSFIRTLPTIIMTSISIGAFLGILGFVFVIPFFAHNIGTGVDPRAVGAATDPNNFSLMLIFCMPLLAHWFSKARSSLEKGLVVLIAVMNIIGLIITYSRGGLIIFSITMALLIIEYRKRFKLKYLGFLMATVSITVLLVITLVPSSYWERQKTVTETKRDTAMARRISYYYVAWDAFKEAPIIGSGPGSFIDFFAGTDYARHFSPDYTSLRRYAHNTYLEHLVGTGILGLLTFLIIIWRSLRDFKIALKNCREKGKIDLMDIISAYRLSFISVALYLIFFSDVYHKYLLVSLALSQVALRVSREEPEKESSEKPLIGR